jgi:hypothetical protein
MEKATKEGGHDAARQAWKMRRCPKGFSSQPQEAAGNALGHPRLGRATWTSGPSPATDKDLQLREDTEGKKGRAPLSQLEDPRFSVAVLPRRTKREGALFDNGFLLQ